MKAYSGEFLGHLPNKHRRQHLPGVRTQNRIGVGGQTCANLDNEGIWGWMRLRNVLRHHRVGVGLRTNLDQPVEGPTKHVIKVGRLVGKVISCEKL